MNKHVELATSGDHFHSWSGASLKIYSRNFVIFYIGKYWPETAVAFDSEKNILKFEN